VVSYRSDGIPSIEELIKLLERYTVREVRYEDYKYVLSSFGLVFRQCQAPPENTIRLDSSRVQRVIPRTYNG
jgi:hypothetical protein